MLATDTIRTRGIADSRMKADLRAAQPAKVRRCDSAPNCLSWYSMRGTPSPSWAMTKREVAAAYWYSIRDCEQPHLLCGQATENSGVWADVRDEGLQHMRRSRDTAQPASADASYDQARLDTSHGTASRHTVTQLLHSFRLSETRLEDMLAYEILCFTGGRLLDSHEREDRIWNPRVEVRE